MTITITTLHSGIILLPFLAIFFDRKSLVFGWLAWGV